MTQCKHRTLRQTPHSAAVVYTFSPGRNLSNRLNLGVKKNTKFFSQAVKRTAIDVLSRWQSMCHLSQKSAAIWWVHMQHVFGTGCICWLPTSNCECVVAGTELITVIIDGWNTDSVLGWNQRQTLHAASTTHRSDTFYHVMHYSVKHVVCLSVCLWRWWIRIT